jgi:predicted dehydrogenase
MVRGYAPGSRPAAAPQLTDTTSEVAAMDDEVRVGLVGYGLAGRDIHTPLLARAGLPVTVIVTSDAGRRANAAADHPGAVLVDGLEALLEKRTLLDLVVLASPTAAHAEQAMACLDAGLAVVVDKPLAIDAAQASAVVDHAERTGGRLTVFQNRRWDAEQLTLRSVVQSGSLGEVFRFERRWERWRPVPKQRWRENAPPAEGGGLLLDLHSHLVDSAVQLFGPVQSVYAELAARSTLAEDDVFVSLSHSGGVRSHLGALSLAGAPGPRTRVLGTEGAYVVTTFEQEATAFTSLADLDDDHSGWLVAGDSRQPVPRADGEHADFYRLAAEWVRGNGSAPVDARDAVAVLRVLDAARISARDRIVVRLD